MSHIVCSAEKIIAAATAKIKYIRDLQETTDSIIINKVMQKVHFFSRKPYTKEDAINSLDNGNMFGWRCESGWRDLDHANNLLTLAKHGDPVTIDLESARVLWG